MSFYLFGYFIFIVNVHVLKNLVAGLSILLIYTLGIKDTFFYSVTELPQGIMFATLFYAWLYFPLKTKRKIPFLILFLVSLVILLICLFYHPMTIFAIIFIIGYYCIENKDYKNKNIALLIVFTILLYSLKMLLTQKASYEGNLFEQLKLTPQLLPQLFHLYSFNFFYAKLFNLYLVTFLISLIIVFYYLKNSDWYKLIWLIVCLIGFLLIAFIAFNKGDSDFAMEKYFVPLSLFLAIPFFNDILLKDGFKYIRTLLFVIILTIGIVRIINNGFIYTKHIKFLENIIEFAEKKIKTHKLILDRKKLDDKVISWANSNETMLCSALRGKKNCVSVYLKDDEFDENYFKRKDLFLCTPFDLCWNINRLNPHYFYLPFQEYKFTDKNIDMIDTVDSKLFFKLNLLENNLNLELSKIKRENSSVFFETNNEFFPFIEMPIANIKKNNSFVDLIINTEIRTLHKIENDAIYLVISLGNDFYLSSKEFNSLSKDSNGWTKVDLITKIKDFENESSILKIYIWNKKREKIQIRNITFFTNK